MTILITIMIGAGIVLVISALEATSIRDTVIAVVTNQPLDLSGKAGASSPLPDFQSIIDAIKGGASSLWPFRKS